MRMTGSSVNRNRSTRSSCTSSGMLLVRTVRLLPLLCLLLGGLGGVDSRSSIGISSSTHVRGQQQMHQIMESITTNLQTASLQHNVQTRRLDNNYHHQQDGRRSASRLRTAAVGLPIAAAVDDGRDRRQEQQEQLGRRAQKQVVLVDTKAPAVPKSHSPAAGVVSPPPTAAPSVPYSNIPWNDPFLDTLPTNNNTNAGGGGTAGTANPYHQKSTNNISNDMIIEDDFVIDGHLADDDAGNGASSTNSTVDVVAIPTDADAESVNGAAQQQDNSNLQQPNESPPPRRGSDALRICGILLGLITVLSYFGLVWLAKQSRPRRLEKEAVSSSSPSSSHEHSNSSSSSSSSEERPRNGAVDVRSRSDGSWHFLSFTVRPVWNDLLQTLTAKVSYNRHTAQSAADQNPARDNVVINCDDKHPNHNSNSQEHQPAILSATPLMVGDRSASEHGSHLPPVVISQAPSSLPSLWNGLFQTVTAKLFRNNSAATAEHPVVGDRCCCGGSSSSSDDPMQCHSVELSGSSSDNDNNHRKHSATATMNPIVVRDRSSSASAASSTSSHPPSPPPLWNGKFHNSTTKVPSRDHCAAVTAEEPASVDAGSSSSGGDQKYSAVENVGSSDDDPKHSLQHATGGRGVSDEPNQSVGAGDVAQGSHPPLPSPPSWKSMFRTITTKLSHDSSAATVEPAAATREDVVRRDDDDPNHADDSTPPPSILAGGHQSSRSRNGIFRKVRFGAGATTIPTTRTAPTLSSTEFADDHNNTNHSVVILFDDDGSTENNNNNHNHHHHSHGVKDLFRNLFAPLDSPSI